jgi:uncharacterized protein (TIGR03067 family)
MAESVLLVPATALALRTRSKADDQNASSVSTAFAQAQPDLEKMQGKWRIVRCEFDGRDEARSLGTVDTINGAQWIRPRRKTGEYRLKFDPGKNPKWVDLTADRLGDKILKGIYSLDGDKLTICYAYDSDLPRPTDFETALGTQVYLYVLERVKS